MRKLILLLTMCGVLAPAVARAEALAPKVVIVKADDVRQPTAKWDRFIAVSREKGVKVSLGVIADSLAEPAPDYVAWLRAHDASGQVEFWHHGWDHKRWTSEAGTELREFQGTGYAHQKEHYEKARAAMERVFGVSPVAFGAPFNAMDEDTARVLNEDPGMRLLFGYNLNGLPTKLLSPLAMRGEHDGTGKPNFTKFVEEYRAKPGLRSLAFQVHPTAV